MGIFDERGRVIMEISMTEQGIVFLFSCVVGVLLGAFYDVFRILRVAFKPKWVVVFFQDIIFCVVSSLVIILSIYYTNSGQVRLFGLTGCFLGFVLYHLTIGKFIMFISTKIIEFIRRLLRVIYNLTVRPLKIAVLFILNFIKKQAGFMSKLFGSVKSHAGDLYERKKTFKLAANGFNLYREVKIPRENRKIINEINKINKKSGKET